MNYHVRSTAGLGILVTVRSQPYPTLFFISKRITCNRAKDTRTSTHEPLFAGFTKKADAGNRANEYDSMHLWTVTPMEWQSCPRTSTGPWHMRTRTAH